MAARADDWIDALISAQRPHSSLDQPFYEDVSIFRREFERVIANQWIMAGHVSQIPREGDYLLFEVAGESIILIRDHDRSVHAHFNVCRHRGSRVLLCAAGHARRLTCPYHGWTYDPDGRLRAAPRMSDGFDTSRYGLKPCHLRIVDGLIFVNLGEGDPPALDAVAEGLAPFLRLHGIADARVIRRSVFPVQANWKLVVENYLECYHCKPAHREYCRVEIKADKIGDGSPAALARYESRYQSWRALAEAQGTLLPDFRSTSPADGDIARVTFGTAYRAPLREAFLTGTEDGKPAAPLMGAFREYDGGETALGLGPFTYMLAYNDYATFFQFVPVSADRSEIVTTWLVAGHAGDGIDAGRLAQLWTVTTEQDKAIIEANAAGIHSTRYEPGPTSPLESDVDGFRQWYLAVLGQGIVRATTDGGRYFGS
jgi:phenylpropionate dioxygenase-like ring-hydroxylating dioxygenase large terminal subunit